MGGIFSEKSDVFQLRGAATEDCQREEEHLRLILRGARS